MPGTSMAMDVATILTAEGVAISGETMFAGWMPSSPDGCLSLKDEQGPQAEYTMAAPDPAVEYADLQIIVRHTLYKDGWDWAMRVHRLLRNFKGMINGTDYLLIRERYSPVFLGRDENNRSSFALNYVGTRRP
jgi:hypothetical protein